MSRSCILPCPSAAWRQLGRVVDQILGCQVSVSIFSTRLRQLGMNQ